ncbi:aminotransferase-like domain-containing protein [Paraburkholderia solisilvae]|uniref:HTH-type transcriptional regulator NorG n=1 Tax=Paraburkholderia solisilvae TaxID=624376 RepID=A0A6J5DLJ4_9BURK|nr:PLP-dependent aminotransferase family protein [Paraburkholderia solisilvae]CAB3754052.1 HTH-type transcriptional regulator NorG [Paraburkholderia solisilvae]
MADITKTPTRIDMTMAAIRQRIESAPGAKLPSIRRLAELQGVFKSTIVEAYDRLVAEGEVNVKPGSGFFAAARVRPFMLAESGPQPRRAIDHMWITRQSMAVNDPSLKPGCGWLPDDWLPGDVLRRIMRRVTREDTMNFTAYGTPQGFLPLRDQLARRLNERNIAADPGALLLTDSATRALDIVCRFLLQPGDTVLIDDPCYFNFQSTLQAQRVNVVGIPYTPQGPDLDRFAHACVEHRPKLYLTMPVLHNPTGTNMSIGTAHRLLKLAETHNVVLVEDSVYADLEAQPSTGLAALDGLERVILIGSFSKTLTGALRCGYIAARGDWIEGLTDLALATSFGTSDLAAQITYRLLVDGSYRHHLESLRTRLARNTAITLEHLDRLDFTLWQHPQGGMFVWAQLPAGLDSGEVAQRAIEHNLVLAPGDAFSLSRTASRYLRFNVTQCGNRRVFDVLARVMQD